MIPEKSSISTDEPGRTRTRATSRTPPTAVLVINTELDPLNLSSVEPLTARLAGALPPSWTVVSAHFSSIPAPLVSEPRPDFIVLSGQGTPWREYPPRTFADIRSFLDTASVPVLGICGGHQLLALAYGGRVGPIRGTVTGNGYGDLFRETGFQTVSILEDDPLFDGIAENALFRQNHVEEVKRIPRGFMLLAEGLESRCQAIRHGKKPVYGVQFHPERFTRRHAAGRKLLRNFFRLDG